MLSLNRNPQDPSLRPFASLETSLGLISEQLCTKAARVFRRGLPWLSGLLLTLHDPETYDCAVQAGGGGLEGHALTFDSGSEMGSDIGSQMGSAAPSPGR